MEVDLFTLEQVEQIVYFLRSLSDEHLLLEAAIAELEDFSNEHFPRKQPKSFRRALALLRHIESSQENSIDELSHTCDRIHDSLNR